MSKPVVLQECVKVASNGTVTRLMLMSENVVREFPIAGEVMDGVEGYWQTNRKHNAQPLLQVLVRGVSTSYDSTGGKLIGVDISIQGEPVGVSELLFLKSVDPSDWLASVQGYAAK